MRFARKLVVVVVGAVAAMAFGASSASALVIENETTGAHCRSVLEPVPAHGDAGIGCRIRTQSVGSVGFSAFGLGIVCNNDLEGRIGETGEGYIYSASFTNCSPINVVECRENGIDDNWPLHFNSETSAEVVLCISAPFQITCHLALNVTEFAAHRYQFNTGGSHRPCENNPGVSLLGVWNQVVGGNHAAVELFHF